MQAPVAAEGTDVADLTLFELGSWGHFPMHMRLILEAWQENPVGILRAIVTNRFLDQHPYVFEGFENRAGSAIRWTTLEADDEAALYALQAGAEGIEENPGREIDPPGGGYLKFHWALVEKYACFFPSRHILLLNLDEYLFALSSSQPAPADLSGIFFRPDFFYRSEFPETSFRRRAFNSLQEKLILRTLNHPQLRVAFFLDPWVADSLQGKGTAQVLCLKEPVWIPERAPTEQERTQTRSRLGVFADRKLFLLAGDIDGRKGVWQVLKSIERLPLEEQARIALAIVGRSDASFEQQLAPRLEAFAASTPVVILRRAEYVDESELSDWFTAADVVLVPYIRFVRVSGILLLAAAHRKPVIAPNQGALGRLTRKYSLGTTADPTDPEGLASAIAGFLSDSPPPGWNADIAYAYAEDRSADKFGKRLLDALTPHLRLAR
jgi:glycosyltransferase involved in cell wall biosynthesis